MRIVLLSLIVAIVGCTSPAADRIERSVREARDGPTDNTGRTSIVVEFTNGDWCELRGPGRFRLLDEWNECDGH
jgi:hypothetical protein